MPIDENPIPSPVAGLAELGRLLEEHRPRLVAMLESRIGRGLGGRFDADSVFQDACIVAQRRWPEFEAQRQQQTDASAYVWLYGIVRQKFIDSWRGVVAHKRNARKDVAWPDRSSQQLGLKLIDTGPGPGSAADREELKQRVRQVLELLPDRDYEVVRMRHFEQLTFKEIAAMLGESENAATQRYVRALKRLKGIWQALFSEDPES